MDILDFAIKMELDGKAYYNKQARSSSSAELTKIFDLLAEEEERHYLFFKNMKEGNMEEATKHIDGSSGTLDKVKNIFIEISEKEEQTQFGEDEIAAWGKALEIEERAESFYREKAGIEEDAEKKRLLSLIADEERNHVYMIDGIISYLKFPDAFADSAQFKNFQSLEGK